MLKAKTGLHSISCFEVPEIFTKDKLVTKGYFAKYGKIARLLIRPKRRSCVIEYHNRDSAIKAVLEGGVYEGQRFRITWTKPRSDSKDIVKELKLVKPVKKWTDDNEIQAELEAMQGTTPYNSYKDVTQKKPFDKAIKSKTVVTKIERPWKMKEKEIEKPIKPKLPEVQINPNSEQAADLLKIISKAAETSEEKYRVLDARDKLLRLKMVRQSNIKKVGKTIGTCPDMCPEKERVMREAQHQVALYEQLGDVKNQMNHAIAVKQYSRSSADQETPLPHELRPVTVLQLTMGYLLHCIMDLCDTSDVNLGEWYHFLWDRTRGIRKDITQQELCCQGSVHLLEQCTRFHIHCSARLVAEDPSVFDQKINTENLTKCLQTLKYMYHDLGLKGERCPNEAEFRGYVVLLNLNDGNFMWEVQQLSKEIQQSPEIKFALKVHSAIDKNNYVKFFKYVHSTTYLNACILLRYFNQVRAKAIRRILKSYSSRPPYTAYPISELTNILAFEDDNSTIEYFEYYGLVAKDRTHIILDRTMFGQPDYPFQLDRAKKVIESKRICSVGEIVCGTTLPPKDYEKLTPHNSFDAYGYLKQSEIPSDIQTNKYLEKVMKDVNEPINLDLDDENMDVAETHSPSKFTFCLPKVETEIDANTPVPEINKTFQFQFPKPIIPPTQTSNKNIFESKPDNNPFKNINIPTSFEINIFSNKNVSTSIFGTNGAVKQPEKEAKNENIFSNVSVSTITKPVEIPVTTNIFANVPIPDVSKTIAPLPEITKTIVFQPIPQLNLEKTDTSIKETAPSLPPKPKLTRSIEEDCPQPAKLIKRTLLPNPISKMDNPFEELKKLQSKDENIKIPEKNTKVTEQKSMKPIQSVFKPQELIDNMNKPVVETKNKEEIQETKKKTIDQTEVKKILTDLVEDVATKAEVDNKLKEISLKIKNRKLLTYTNRWKNIVMISKRKRKIFFDNPVWISSRSVNEEARELYLSSQNVSLNDMKRYKKGIATYSPPKITKNKITKLNIFSTVAKILLEKFNSFSDYPQLDIFWKISISITIKNTQVSQDIDSTLQDALDWKPMNNNLKIIDKNDITNGATLTYSIEKITNNINNDLNGLLFIVDYDSLSNFKTKFKAIFNNKRAPVPVIILCINSPETDNNFLINTLKLDDLVNRKCISSYEVVFLKGNITKPVLTATLQWLAHNITPTETLQMNTIPSILQICVGNELWHRINANSKLNNRLHILLRQPNVAISLYNIALNYLEHLYCHEELNCVPNFPNEFKIYINDSYIMLPCSYEYFPENWKSEKYYNNFKQILKDMRLPEFCSNWPPSNIDELEYSLEKYCAKVFNNSNTFLKIIQAFSTLADFETEDLSVIWKTVTWANILPIIINEKINTICENENNVMFYKLKDLKDLCKTPWWYSTEEISVKIRTVQEEIAEEILEDYVDSDEDIEDIDINKTIKDVTEEIIEEDYEKEGLKKEYTCLIEEIEDLERSIKIQQKIMSTFMRTANTELD